jgi:hypothetical protein
MPSRCVLLILETKRGVIVATRYKIKDIIARDFGE